MTRIIRLLLLALVLLTYFVFGPFGYLIFILWGLIPTRHPVRRARVLLTIQRYAFRMVHWVARTIRALEYYPSSVKDQLPAQPSIFIANHPTLTDTPAVLSSFPNTVTVVKPSVFHQWWTQPLFRSAGFIESPGADYTRLPAIMDAAEERLQQGFNILFFPEGTRSPEGQLLPFGRTAFEISCRTGAPIVPIAITCTPLFLSKEYPFHKLRPSMAKLRLKVLPAVHPNDYGADSRALRAAVRAEIEKNIHTTVPQVP